MAIPSGSGTEVLKRFIKDGQDNTESKAIDGVADHIYTVLSIIVKNQVLVLSKEKQDELV